MDLLSRIAKRLFPRSQVRQQPRIHYLHIGKTAGNQIKHVCNQITATNPEIVFKLWSHGQELYKIPPADSYFFSIRNPITRFKAGFYERKRQGRDGGNVWSENEALAFSVFPHANNLAEALFESGDLGRRARAAMHSIQHVRKHQYQWFLPLGYFLENRPPIWIIRQENFDSDIAAFASRLGIEELPESRASDYQAKRTDYSEIPELTEVATLNLEKWYSADIQFYSDSCHYLDSLDSI